MTEPTTVDKPRPGSRADRMSQPLLRTVLRDLAERYGVCVRPLVVRRIERATGRVDGVLDIPCGARMAAKCKPCANRNRKLRQRQIREGWHLTEEPTVAVEQPTSEVVAMLHLRADFLFERELAVRAEKWDQVADLDGGIAELDELLSGQRVRGTLPKPSEPRKPRAVRSTKRRQDAPKLPRRPVENRSVGRTYRAKDGKEHRPSMLLTAHAAQLRPGAHRQADAARPARGRAPADSCTARHDQQLGTPMDPDGYDYRRARPVADLLPAPAGPVLAELPPRRRLEDRLRRRRRDATPPRHPRPLRRARHHPAGADQAGRGRHLPPGVVATVRHA